MIYNMLYALTYILWYIPDMSWYISSYMAYYVPCLDVIYHMLCMMLYIMTVWYITMLYIIALMTYITIYGIL